MLLYEYFGNVLRIHPLKGDRPLKKDRIDRRKININPHDPKDEEDLDDFIFKDEEVKISSER